MFRLVLHIFLIAATVYFLISFLIMSWILNHQRYPGQYTWIAQRLSRMPYGALFFEEGEYYDCGVCFEGIYKGTTVVRLVCGGDDRHVFHYDCILTQVSKHANQYCVLCHSPMVV